MNEAVEMVSSAPRWEMPANQPRFDPEATKVEFSTELHSAEPECVRAPEGDTLSALKEKADSLLRKIYDHI